MVLAREVFREYSEKEEYRRSNQLMEITDAFKAGLEKNKSELIYESVIYDEVKKILVDGGFEIKTVTMQNGKPGYLITVKKEYQTIDSILICSMFFNTNFF